MDDVRSTNPNTNSGGLNDTLVKTQTHEDGFKLTPQVATRF